MPETIASVIPEILETSEEDDGVRTTSSSQGSDPKGPEGAQAGRQPVSTLKAYVNLVTVLIGAGIMALPQLPVRGGWVLSPLILLMVMLTTAESALQMWKAFMASRASQHGKFEMSTYEDLGREAWGPVGQMLAALVVNTFLFGVYSAYAVLVGMQLANLAQALDKQLWILIMYPVFIALALLPDLSALSKFVPLGMVAACATAVCIICKSLLDASRWGSWDLADGEELHSPWPQEPAALGVVLATCIGAMTFHPVVPAVIQDMKTPEQFPLAMTGAVVTCGSLYMAVIVCGYYGYGNFIQGDVVQSMAYSPASFDQAFNVPSQDWTGAATHWVLPVMATMVLINITLSMPLNAMSIFYSIQDFKHFASYVKPGTWANWAMRVVVVTFAVAIALCVPQFTLVYGFFCAAFAPVVSLVFPLLFAGAVLRRAGKRQTWLRAGLHGFIMILSVFCMVAGLYGTILDFFGISA
mmetsp:Transcript_50237/g.117235  ORF Transcript_50237/g.117235 Transcript_50237/m.117235 type:complete len:469 (+) Transcript_50237:13-1419(+)